MLKQHVSLFKYICLCRSLFCQAKTNELANHCLPKKPLNLQRSKIHLDYRLNFMWWLFAFASYYCNSSIYIYQFAVHFTRLSHDKQPASSTFTRKHSGEQTLRRFPTQPSWRIFNFLPSYWRFCQLAAVGNLTNPLDFTMEILRSMLRCDPAGAVFQETLNDLSERDREAPPTGDAVIVFFGYN